MKNPYQNHFQKLKKANSVPKKKMKFAQPKARVRKVKRKKESSKLGAFLSIIFAFAVVGYLFFPDEISGQLSRVQIGLFTTADAADKSTNSKKSQANKSQGKVEKSAKTSAKDKSGNSKEVAEREPAFARDSSYFSKLQEKEMILGEREKGLVQLEGDLQQQKEELEIKIAELKKLRGEISTLLKDRVETDEKKIMKLVEFYSNMKPQRAAQIINSLDEDLAVGILDKMKKRSAAAILNLVDPLKAQVLSEKFAEYKK